MTQTARILDGRRLAAEHREMVRQRARDERFWPRETAIEMLAYNDDAGTRDLLLKIIAEDAENEIV